MCCAMQECNFMGFKDRDGIPAVHFPVQYVWLKERGSCGLVLQFPFFCKDREYVMGRRIWSLGDAYFCITKVGVKDIENSNFKDIRVRRRHL